MTERDPDTTRDGAPGVSLVTRPTVSSALTTHLGYHRRPMPRDPVRETEVAVRVVRSRFASYALAGVVCACVVACASTPAPPPDAPPSSVPAPPSPSAAPAPSGAAAPRMALGGPKCDKEV